MTEELEQLLKNLKLRRMLSCLRRTVARGRESADLLLGVRGRTVARAMARPAGECPGVAHPRSESAGTLVAGNVSVGSASPG